MLSVTFFYVMLSVAFLVAMRSIAFVTTEPNDAFFKCYAECPSIFKCYAECSISSFYAEFRSCYCSAQCRYAVLSVIMLSVVAP